MDIGKQERVIIVEPLRTPATAPVEPREPSFDPVEPEEQPAAPERELEPQT
jgi:virulence-associated protein VagC